MMRIGVISLTLGLLSTVVHAKDDGRDALWAAVRNSDVKALQAALDKGADVNARNEIGITALWIAGSKGNREVVELLIKRGGDVNARDLIWYQTPLSSAVGGGHLEVVKLLLGAGARDVDNALLTATSRRNLAIVQEVLKTGKVRQEALDGALFTTRTENKELREALLQAGAKEIKPASEQDRAAWKEYAGTYASDNGGSYKIEVGAHGLMAGGGVGGGQLLKPLGPDRFAPYGSDASFVAFEREGGQVRRVRITRYTAESIMIRVDDKPLPVVVKPPQDLGDVRITSVLNWPSFRGPDATGVADGQHPPLTWDVKKGENLRWKTAIPGFGHSCPIVWGDRVFLTTAVSGDPDPKVRTGNYGDVASVNDTSKHTWHVLCLDRDTGQILWNKQAFEGVPKIKRHLKGSQANCTPATDGKRVVACFGSEGLYCYDFTGKLIWQRDMSTVDSSFSMDREYEWGFGSSPIIHEGMVILQCDLSKDSFIAAYSLENGDRVWSTPRDEIPSWSSPALWRTSQGVQVVTNAAQYARGYDPLTGKELWRLAKKSEVTIPAPVPGKDLLYITSGNRPIQPIFAIRPDATGDISLKENEERNSHVVWSRMRGGPYMPTPILYGEHFYTIGNGGIVTCYEAASGKEVYKERLGGTSYTASPVAADGRLYFLSEQGEVRVLKAGPKFELLAMNEVEDVCLATTAISAGMLFVRSQKHLFALGRPLTQK
jgi:outer membrane protein assembly factor BamB